jgi:hypothetical protein
MLLLVKAQMVKHGQVLKLEVHAENKNVKQQVCIMITLKELMDNITEHQMLVL